MRLSGKAEWFRMQPDHMEEIEPEDDWETRVRSGRPGSQDTNKYVESVIFVPFTPESQLKTTLSRLEGRLGFKTR